MQGDSRFYAPPDLPIAPNAELLITLGSAIGALAAFIVAVRFWRKTGSLIPLALLIGAGLAVINEPFVDLLGKCYHNATAQFGLFEIFQRPIPLWGLFGYVIIYGVIAWCIAAGMRRGLRQSRLWLIIIALCLLQVAMEMVILPTNLYYYYDYQPWSFFGMPMHWLALNFSGTVLTAGVLALAWPYLTGRRQALVFVLPMATQTLCSYLIGLPLFVALHSEAGPAAMWFGATVTIVLAVVFISCVARNVERGMKREASTFKTPDPNGRRGSLRMELVNGQRRAQAGGAHSTNRRH